MNVDYVCEVIKEKFGYEEIDFALIKSFILASIQYFGEEYSDKIYRTFLETPIIFFSDRDDLLKKVNNLGIKGDYRLASVATAAYEEFYQKNEDGVIERIPFVLLRNDRKDDLDKLITDLSHELCHAIMNKDKQIIDGDTVYTKTGLIEEVITFNGSEKNMQSINSGIEEGLNEYDARRITEIILGKSFNDGAYQTYVEYVSSLMNNDVLRKIIDSSRLNGDDLWKQVIGEELSNEFISSLMNYENAVMGNRDLPKEKRKEIRNYCFNIMNQTYDKLLDFSKNFEQYYQEQYM